jgi:hypothetical protein
MTGWLRKFRLPRPTGQGLRTFALFMGAPIFGGLLAWQLYGLEPERVCSIPGAFVDNKDLASILNAFNACIGLYAKALDIKDHAVIGLLAILGLGYLMMMMRELRMQGEFTGPGGFGGKFRSEEAAVERAADEVASAAVDKADEIKGA